MVRPRKSDPRAARDGRAMSTVTLSFLDAMSALWRPESVDMVERAIRDALGTARTIDVMMVDSACVYDAQGIRVHLFVRNYEGSATGSTLELARGELGLIVRCIGSPTIPRSLLSARVEIQPAWLTSA